MSLHFPRCGALRLQFEGAQPVRDGWGFLRLQTQAGELFHAAHFPGPCPVEAAASQWAGHPVSLEGSVLFLISDISCQ